MRVVSTPTGAHTLLIPRLKLISPPPPLHAAAPPPNPAHYCTGISLQKVPSVLGGDAAVAPAAAAAPASDAVAAVSTDPQVYSLHLP